MFKKIESMGANFNAQTDRELCGYYVDCFAKDRRFAVDLLADCVMNSVLEERHIEYQKNVVLQEKEHCANEVWSVLKESINLNAFRGHEISSSLLGSKRDIKKIKKSVLREYLNDNYVGENMCFVGTGDIRHDELESLVGKYFSQVPSGTPSYSPSPIFQSCDSRQRTTDTDLCFFMLGLPFKGLCDANLYTLSILSKLYNLPDYVLAQSSGNWFKILKKIKILSKHIGSSAMIDG